MKFPKFLRWSILKNISKRLLLFNLLFYCESGINQYVVQKILTDVFGASLLLLELGCLRYVLLLYHLWMLRVFMRIFLAITEFYSSYIYRRRNKRLRETILSMLSCGALERSNNPCIEAIVEPCVSKNQKSIFAMWVWLERESWKRADAMEKISLSRKQNLCVCVWEKWQ